MHAGLELDIPLHFWVYYKEHSMTCPVTNGTSNPNISESIRLYSGHVGFSWILSIALSQTPYVFSDPLIVCIYLLCLNTLVFRSYSGHDFFYKSWVIFCFQVFFNLENLHTLSNLSTSGTLAIFIWRIQLDKNKKKLVKFYFHVKIPSVPEVDECSKMLNLLINSSINHQSISSLTKV